MADILTCAAVTLETARAGLLLIGANTMHRAAGAGAVSAAGLQRVGLLGTRATLEQTFYADRLAANGAQILTPPPADQERLNRLIFEELCRGVVTEAGRKLVSTLIRELQAQGAQGVILGCTELGGVARAVV